MTKIKRIFLIGAIFVAGCAVPLIPPPAAAPAVPLAVGPTSGTGTINADGRLQCKLYHLPEFEATPKPPTIDLSRSSKVSADAQKLALVVYIDQLRAHVAEVKGSARTSYMRYLLTCVD
jgi:hypothetical protein